MSFPEKNIQMTSKTDDLKYYPIGVDVALP